MSTAAGQARHRLVVLRPVPFAKAGRSTGRFLDSEGGVDFDGLLRRQTLVWHKLWMVALDAHQCSQRCVPSGIRLLLPHRSLVFALLLRKTKPLELLSWRQVAAMLLVHCPSKPRPLAGPQPVAVGQHKRPRPALRTLSGMAPVGYLETGVIYCDDNLRRLSQFPA